MTYVLLALLVISCIYVLLGIDHEVPYCTTSGILILIFICIVGFMMYGFIGILGVLGLFIVLTIAIVAIVTLYVFLYV